MAGPTLEALHGTLVANTAATAGTLVNPELGVDVLNVDGASAIYGTLDGSTPTVGGTNCFCVPAAIGAVQVAFTQGGGQNVVVKLISAGTPTYHVTGINS